MTARILDEAELRMKDWDPRLRDMIVWDPVERHYRCSVCGKIYNDGSVRLNRRKLGDRVFVFADSFILSIDQIRLDPLVYV